MIVQSLFAIGTGDGLDGTLPGSPEKIPVVKNDFIFSAICEELWRDFCHLPDLCVYELFPYYRGDCPADQESIL